MPFCPRCGKSTQHDSAFCTHCGTRITGARPDEATALIETAGSGSLLVTQERIIERLRQLTLGEYEILGELGHGGMATVILAHEVTLNRKVAIKVMSPALLAQDPGIRERFKREAQTAAALSHPHIIPIYTVRESEDLVFFVMKYIDGRSLETVIQEVGALPIPVVQTILQQIGSALDHAHQRGVVHRDMKPGNVMLDRDGWVVVTDFGIAKVAGTQALTVTGGVVGTPAYMSPEQCSGQPVTGASDQYSLGVMAYEMLTGRQPFEATSLVTLMYEHVHTAPRPIRELRPDCPLELEKAVLRMLAKSPGERFPSVAEAIASIAAAEVPQDVRSQMATLVQRTSTGAILEKFQTPRSPVPPSTKRAGTVPAEQASAPAAAARRRMRIIPVYWIAPAAIAAAAVAWFLLSRGDGSTTATTPATQAPAAEIAATPVARLVIAPATAAIPAGGSIALSPTAYGPQGEPVEATVTWETSDPSIATVTPGGTVTAHAAGTALITGRVASSSATVAVTVTPAPARVVSGAAPPTVARVRVVPEAIELEPGATAQLAATPLDAGDRPVSGTVRWSSSDPAVAEVLPTGSVRALRPGSARISATAGGREGTSLITVRAAEPAAVVLDANTLALEPGQSRQVSAQARDAQGRVVDAPITWQSEDPTVATVSQQGVVRAERPGSTTVIARSGNATGQLHVSVQQALAPPAPAAPGPEAGIRQALERYREAIESENIDALRSAYPGLTRDQERAWNQFFETASGLRAEFEIVALNVRGEEAEARVSATYRFATDRDQVQRTEFTARLARTAGAWRITGIR
ncbi:Serine/threonine-protein kinase PrkC [bacterium HR33]|nr:Serine/threonine-protein kinase PrkC [bacterium HR33]